MNFSEGRFGPVLRLLQKWPWLLILFLMLAVFSRLGIERETNTLNWVFTHYLFNYGDEFVKRGLVGEVLRWLPWDVDRELIQRVSIVLTAAVCLMVSSFLVCFYRLYNSKAALIMVLLVGLSPAALLHFMFDVGRFDAVLYSFFTLFCLIFTLEKKRSPYGDGLVVMLLILLMLLVHEAAFFMLVPLLLGCWHLSDDSRLAKKMQCLSAVFAFFMTFIVSTEGAYTQLSFDEHFELLRLQQGLWVNSASLMVLHGTGLLENMYITLWSLSTLRHYWEYIGLVFLLLPLFVFLFGLIRSIGFLLGKQHLLILVGATAPLMLCLLGTDHFRWFALIITNFFLGLLFIFIKDAVIWREAQSYIVSNQYLAGLVILTGFLLGPIGVNRGFEIVDSVVSLLY